MLFSAFSTNFFQTVSIIFQYCIHLIGEVKFWKARYLMAQNELVKAKNSLDHYKDLYDGLLSLHAATLGRVSALQTKEKTDIKEHIKACFDDYPKHELETLNNMSKLYDWDDIETIVELIECLVDIAKYYELENDELETLQVVSEDLQDKIDSLESEIDDLKQDIAVLESSQNDDRNDCLDFDNLNLGLFYRDKYGNNHKLTITKGLTVCYQINDSYSKDCAGKQAKMNISSFKMMGSICQWYANLLGDDLYCSPNSNQKYKLYQRFGWVPYGATSLKLSPII